MATINCNCGHESDECYCRECHKNIVDDLNKSIDECMDLDNQKDDLIAQIAELRAEIKVLRGGGSDERI